MGVHEFNPYRFEPALRVTPNGLEFTVRGEPGRTVRIERSRNLVNWELVATVPIPASGQRLIDPAANTEPFLFYRAVPGPGVRNAAVEHQCVREPATNEIASPSGQSWGARRRNVS